MCDRTNRRLIFLSSADDISLRDTSSNYGRFKINLPSSISPVSMKLLSFNCSNTILTINTTLYGILAGAIPIIENGTTSYTATVPDGSYNAITLASTMATIMTAASLASGLGYTYTCVADTVNFKFTWTSTGPFQFNWSITLPTFYLYDNAPPMYTTTGFRSINEIDPLIADYPAAPATIVTSTYFYSLLNPNPIFIRITPFTSNITTSRGLYANFCITSTTNNGDVLTWNENMGYKQEIICPNTPVTFQLGVEILDQYGNVVPYHSIPVCLLLEIEEPVIRR